MRFVLYLHELVSSFTYFESVKEKVSPSDGGLSVTGTKVDGWPGQGKRTPHLTVRYVVLQCCHYLRSAADVLKT